MKHPGISRGERTEEDTMKRALIAGLIASTTVACLVKETTHTIYLQPDGSLTWVVLEREIRSLADTPEQRLAQEEEFLHSFHAGQHGTRQAFEALYCDRFASQLLREQRPFAVWSEADFSSLEQLTRDLMARLSIPAQVSMWHEDSVMHWQLEVFTDQVGEDYEPEDDSVVALLDDIESYQIRLTHGKLIDAHGFQLEEDDTVARLVELSEEELAANDNVARYYLAWTSE
jgi:hypothetical protein